MKYRACVLNTIEDRQGDRFTIEALERLAYEAHVHAKDGLPVLLDFNSDCELGRANNFAVEGNELLCDLDLTVDEIPVELVPVVGIEYEIQDEHARKDPTRLFAIGLTREPTTIDTWIRPCCRRDKKSLGTRVDDTWTRVRYRKDTKSLKTKADTPN